MGYLTCNRLSLVELVERTIDIPLDRYPHFYQQSLDQEVYRPITFTNDDIIYCIATEEVISNTIIAVMMIYFVVVCHLKSFCSLRKSS